MKHLDFEWSKKLKDWGFPQGGNGEDGWFYKDFSFPKDKKTIWIPVYAAIMYHDNPSHIIKSPNLEELLEWTILKCKEIISQDCFIDIGNGDDRGKYGASYIFYGNSSEEDDQYPAFDEDPKIALCKLLDKIVPSVKESQ